MMINYLVFGITCLVVSATVAEAATLRNGLTRPRLTLSMASRSRSAMQSMREFALYMGPKGLRLTPEELERQRLMDYNFIIANQRQLMAENKDFPHDQLSQLPEFPANENAGQRRGIKCRRRADGKVERADDASGGSDIIDDSDFEGCTATDDDLLEDSGAAVCDLFAIPYLFSMIVFVLLIPRL